MSRTTKSTRTVNLSPAGLLDALRRRGPKPGELITRNGNCGLWVGLSPGGAEWVCWSCSDVDWRKLNAALNRAWERAR